MKHCIFMYKINYWMGKIIFALANSFSHGQNNDCMGNLIIALAKLLLHGEIYHCMDKSIIAWANLLSMGNLFLFVQNFFSYATKDSFQTQCTDFMRIISLRLIIKCAPIFVH